MSIKPINQQTLQPTLTPHQKKRLIQSAQIFQADQTTLANIIDAHCQANPFIKAKKSIPSTPTSSSYSSKEDSAWDLHLTAADPLTTEEYLLFQLRTFDSVTQTALIQLIHHLDDQGYLREDSQKLCHLYDWQPSQFTHYLTLLQSLNPTGIGARNLQECLILQANAHPEGDLASTMLTDYFQEMAAHQFEVIADLTQNSLQAVKESFQIIQTFNPYPLTDTPKVTPPPLIPDLIVSYEEDRFNIQCVNDYIPNLSFNQSYFNHMQDLNTEKDPELTAYLNQQRADYQWLIHTLDERKESLFQVVQTILSIQGDYFQDKQPYLNVLTQNQIAQKIQKSPSTISRLMHQKYLQFNGRVFPLNHWLSPSLTQEGPSLSLGHFKIELQALIANESSFHPLSDQALTNLFQLKGYSLSRRVLTKYRQLLGFPSSRQRKRKKH